MWGQTLYPWKSASSVIFARHPFSFAIVPEAKSASFQCPEFFILSFVSRSVYPNNVESSVIDLSLCQVSQKIFPFYSGWKKPGPTALCFSLPPLILPGPSPHIAHFSQFFPVPPRPAKEDGFLFRCHPDPGSTSSPLPSLNSWAHHGRNHPPLVNSLMRP